MSKLKELREAIDTQLDRLDAQLDAWEAQLETSRDEVLERVQERKANLAETADSLAGLVGKSREVADELVGDLRSELEHLQVQLALGRAETREAYAEQREKIQAAIGKVEAGLGRLEDKVEEELADEMARFVRLSDRLRAELEAAEVQFALLRAEAREALEGGRAEIEQKIRTLRAEVAERGANALERYGEFEEEFVAGLAHIRKAFMGLLTKG